MCLQDGEFCCFIGVPCDPKSILERLKEYVNNIYYAAGCQDVACNSTAYFSKAVSAAKKVEYVIVVAGLDLSQETEDRDRYSLLLPGHQMELVTSVAAVSKNPVILVLTGGGPLDVSFAVRDPRVGSILWIGYPGETGGTALSEIIFGHYNPGKYANFVVSKYPNVKCLYYSLYKYCINYGLDFCFSLSFSFLIIFYPRRIISHQKPQKP